MRISRTWPVGKVLVLVAAMGLSSAAGAQTVPFVWPTADPVSVGIDAALPEQLRKKLRGNPRLLSLGIVRHGQLVFEHYHEDVGKDSLINVASVTKSVLALLVGIAIEKGVLASVDQPLTDFFPELQQEGVDPASRGLTLRHLLSMSSGWEGTPEDLPPADPLLALKRKIVLEPGGTFQYDNVSSHLIGIALSRAAGRSLEAFAGEHLFTPLGIERFVWGRDFQGRTQGWHMLQVTLRDMLKFGQLVLRKGDWQGHRVVSAGWIDEMLTQRNAGGPHSFLPYGYQWYLSRTPDKRHVAFMGIGYGGQLLYLVPALDTVIAVTHTRDRRARNEDFSVLREIVMPAIQP